MPTPIAVYFVTSAGADTTSLVTPSFTPSNGELITVGLTTWDTGNPSGSVSGGGQTYSNAVTAAPGGFNGYARIDACTVAGSPGSMTITSGGTATNSRHSMCVIRWPVGTTLGAVNATKSGSGAPSANVTTTAAASALFWMWTDVASLDPATLALRLSGTSAGTMDGHVGANSVQYAAYAANVGAAGTYAVGATAPSPQTWAMVAVEILDVGGTTWTVDATDSAGLTDTATIDRSTAVTDSVGLTDAATITRQSAVTDSTGLTDSATIARAPAVTDSTGLTDTTAITRSSAVTDSVGLTDTAAVGGSQTYTDNVGLTDGVVITTFDPSAPAPEWAADNPHTAWDAGRARTAWTAGNVRTSWRAGRARGD